MRWSLIFLLLLAAILVPFVLFEPQFERLGARPAQPIFQAPFGRSRAELLASEARFVTLWVDLPTAGQRAAYQRELDARFGTGRTVLRSLAEWRREFAMPHSQIAFFSFWPGGGPVGPSTCALSADQGLSRGAELGVTGAGRRSLDLLAVWPGLPAGAARVLLAPGWRDATVSFFNRYEVVDTPASCRRLVVFAALTRWASVLLGAVYPAWRCRGPGRPSICGALAWLPRRTYLAHHPPAPALFRCCARVTMGFFIVANL